MNDWFDDHYKRYKPVFFLFLALSCYFFPNRFYTHIFVMRSFMNHKCIDKGYSQKIRLHKLPAPFDLFSQYCQYSPFLLYAWSISGLFFICVFCPLVGDKLWSNKFWYFKNKIWILSHHISTPRKIWLLHFLWIISKRMNFSRTDFKSFQFRF